jgi:hypothetical protein
VPGIIIRCGGGCNMSKRGFSTAVEELLWEIKKIAVELRVNLNDLIDECFKCIAANNKTCKDLITVSEKMHIPDDSGH